MRFSEISPSVYRARRKATNVYLVYQGSNSVLIDTGEPSFAPAIRKALSGFPPVQQILLTHAHYDHAGSAAELSRDLNAEVLAHPADADLLKLGKWRRPAQPAPNIIGHLFTRLIANRFPDLIDAVPDIKSLDDRSEVAIAGSKIIDLPGHSAGQIGFGITQSDGHTIWVVGDVLVTTPRLGAPIRYEDRAQGLSSIAILAQQLRSGDRICPGHGAPVRIDTAVIDRVLRISNMRDARKPQLR